jgi:pyridoxal biosynthesis lyase PdxS
MEEQTGTYTVKKGLAQMLKGGVIMDAVTVEHARIAEVSRNLGESMSSRQVSAIPEPELISSRGW